MSFGEHRGQVSARSFETGFGEENEYETTAEIRSLRTGFGTRRFYPMLNSGRCPWRAGAREVCDRSQITLFKYRVRGNADSQPGKPNRDSARFVDRGLRPLPSRTNGIGDTSVKR